MNSRKYNNDPAAMLEEGKSIDLFENLIDYAENYK